MIPIDKNDTKKKEFSASASRYDKTETILQLQKGPFFICYSNHENVSLHYILLLYVVAYTFCLPSQQLLFLEITFQVRYLDVRYD